MANIQIPNLPAVASLSGQELFEGVQAGSSVKISLDQIAEAVRFDSSLTIPVLISQGGTGATTAPDARTNLGLGTIATQDDSAVAITGGSISGITDLAVADGGTGASNAAGARTNLGLGTISTQNANAVAITGGTINGTTVGATTRAAVNATSLNANAASVISVGSPSTALTITQTGSGNALLVEDDVSPDSTPFVVTAQGRVGIGTQSPSTLLDVYSATNNTVSISGDAATNLVLARSSDTSGGSGFNFHRYRGSTALPLPVANTDTIGSSQYNAWDGVQLVTVAQIRAIVNDFTAADHLSGIIQFFTRPNILASPLVERFRMGPAGQFGIGGANYGTAGQTILSGGTGAAPSWGAVGPAGGGTGITSYTIGDIVFASGATTLSRLADVATGNALISGGVGVAPSYGKIGLTTHVSGVLPVANGGTGVTSAPAEAARILGFTTTATAAGTTVLTNASTQYQQFTGVTTQTITLPVTSTLGTGWSFHIVNNSTANLTVNSSGGNLVATIIAGVTAMITCVDTTLTTAAAWEAGFTDFASLTGTGSVVLGTGPTITAGVYSGTVGASSPSTGAFTTVTASTSILSTGAGGIGYATGAGVAVTQLTSRTTTTPTTGDKTTGSITVFTATAVVGTYFSFTVPNTAIELGDTVVLTVRGGANTYIANCSSISNLTSFRVSMVSVAGTSSDAPIVNFTIIRGVSA